MNNIVHIEVEGIWESREAKMQIKKYVELNSHKMYTSNLFYLQDR